ncbi:MAG: glutathione S-transferase family protein [Betaproteobacteria bacterium]|nr:glutathione S-transferase family protein [Betaproteobacteria bacterium]
MGMMVNGVWTDDDHRNKGGAFVRAESAFRDRVTADGSSGFKAEAGRYHLYVAKSCPWAHRTMVFRALKGLDEAIPISYLGTPIQGKGWEFTNAPGYTPDPLFGAAFMHEIYAKAVPNYTGRVTVPVLWDRQSSKIVNNESPEIIRMLNTEFDAFAKRKVHDLYPTALRSDIDRWNDLIYRTINNGVYRAGFATVQEKYDEAVRGVFATLGALESHLMTHRYLCGARTTEADWRLFPTLVRFDSAYHGHFKCNLRRLTDYENVWAYTRDLYQTPGIADTVDLEQIKFNYYHGQRQVNPSGVVAIGPKLEFNAPHGRERLASGS